MNTYRILPGNTFRADDGSLLEAPATLELADDVARLHAGKVALVAAAAEPDAAAAEHTADPA